MTYREAMQVVAGRMGWSQDQFERAVAASDDAFGPCGNKQVELKPSQTIEQLLDELTSHACLICSLSTADARILRAKLKERSLARIAHNN